MDRITARAASISRLLAAGTSLLLRGSILLVLIIGTILLLSRIGRLGGALPGTSKTSMPKVVEAEPIDWTGVDTAVVEAASRARLRAEEHAGAELDRWTAQLLLRVDEEFLPWYFGYWNQQSIGLKACWQGVKYKLAGTITDGATPSPAEQMMQDIQAEFASRVLRPESAQLRLEQITQQTMDIHLADLRQSLHEIRTRYRIPAATWDRYLEGIAATVHRVDGNRSVPLSLKAVTASGVSAAAIAARCAARVGSRLETRLAAKFAERPAAQLAAKAGARVAARAGGKMLGPIVAVGVIIWDVWDHRRTVAENRPVLRGALAEYLGLMKESLLRDPETGVLAAIHEIETGISADQRNKTAVAQANTAR